jgi:hypothetical protein
MIPIDGTAVDFGVRSSPIPKSGVGICSFAKHGWRTNPLKMLNHRKASYFFTSEHSDFSKGWKAFSGGIVANNL